MIVCGTVALVHGLGVPVVGAKTETLDQLRVLAAVRRPPLVLAAGRRSRGSDAPGAVAGVLSYPAAASSGARMRRAVWVTVSAACRTMLRSPPAQPAT